MSQSIEEESNSSLEDVINFHQEAREDQDVSVACPWFTEKTRRLQDPILRMHNEAIEFCLFTQPSKQEYKDHVTLYEKVKRIIQFENESVLVLAPFLINRLYLKDTEPDCYLLIDQLSPSYATGIAEKLSQSMGVNLVPETAQKYEIFQVEVESEGSRLIVRMLERSRWEEFLTLVEQGLSQITEIRFIYLIISCTVRQRWMNLTIRPFLLFALISVFYHERRKHKVRTLTENIIKFIEYYGVGPFQERRISYLGKSRYELVQEGPPPTPFSFWINERTNIANSSVKELFGFLKNRYRLISNYNFDEQQSIIALLVNPCRKVFSY